MIIHILDDDPTILEAMDFLLTPLQYHIQTWRDSRDFIKQVDPYQIGRTFP